MVDWAKLLTDGIPTKYPQYERADGRVQITVGVGRHALLLRNPYFGHWCGYVVVPMSLALELESEHTGLGLSYVAPAGRNVTWMKTTQAGKLSIPTTLFDSDAEPDGDFWVGFDTMVSAEKIPMPEGTALTQLLAFEEVIWGLRNDDSGTAR